jgi:hypothetical protein
MTSRGSDSRIELLSCLLGVHLASKIQIESRAISRISPRHTPTLARYLKLPPTIRTSDLNVMSDFSDSVSERGSDRRHLNSRMNHRINLTHSIDSSLMVRSQVPARFQLIKERRQRLIRYCKYLLVLCAYVETSSLTTIGS